MTNHAPIGKSLVRIPRANAPSMGNATVPVAAAGVSPTALSAHGQPTLSRSESLLRQTGFCVKTFLLGIGGLILWALALLWLVGESVISPPVFIPTSTQYGPGYSETQFERLALGTPVEKVRTLLGPPLAGHDHDRVWIYSFHNDGWSPYFRSRSISFSNRVVVAKWSFINCD
jgi:hypothetical protein